MERPFKAKVRAFLLVVAISLLTGVGFGFMAGYWAGSQSQMTDAHKQFGDTSPVLSGQDMGAAEGEPMNRATRPPEEAMPPVPDPNASNGPKAEGKVDFSFYNDLPKAKVSPGQKNQKSAQKTEIGQDGQLPAYILQVGSFSKRSEAEQHLNSLVSLGFPSTHIRQHNQDDQLLYRVIIGPFRERSEAQKIRKILQKNKINNFITVDY